MKYKAIIMIAMVLFSLSFVSADLSDYILGYWNLDETSGDAIDQVEGQWNATNNGATQGETGIINNAYTFTRPGDYLNVTQGNVGACDDNNCTVSIWINESFSSGNHAIWFDGVTGVSTLNNSKVINVVGTDSIRIQYRNDNGDLDSFTTSGLGNEWTHVVGRFNVTSAGIYINGQLKGAIDLIGNFDLTPDTTTFGAVVGSGGVSDTYNGKLDEMSYFNTTLTDDEIELLYNNGNALAYPFPPSISVTLDNPTNATSTDKSTVNFNATASLNAVNLTNATLWVWEKDGTLFNNTVTNTITGSVSNTTSFTIQDFSANNYLWNVLFSGVNSTGGTIKDFADSNFSLTIGATFNTFDFSSPVLETSTQTFITNITIPSGSSIQNGILNYNGTNYTNANKVRISGNNWSLSKTISIPAGTSGFSSELRNFSWFVRLADETTGNTFTQESSENEQNVTELVFQICTPTINNPLINFTMKNELNGDEINATNNATTFVGFFEFWVGDKDVVKNYSINNQTVDTSRFNFCTNDPSNSFRSDAEIEYTAVDFSDRKYFLSNANLSNSTSLVNLFLLPDSDSIQFFVTVLENIDPVEDATVNIAKYFVDEGVYKSVDIKETDSSGEFTTYLELDQKYRFTITDSNGDVLDIIDKTAICQAAPCELSLNIETAAADIFGAWETAFASDVVYNLSFDRSTKLVNFDFVDTTGLATSFRLLVENIKYNESSITVCDQTLFTSSGSMTCNVTGYTGDFKATTYISRSPAQLLDYIIFTLEDIVNDLGLTGLFASLLLILVIIFGLSFKPSMLVLAIPLALYIAKLMAFVPLPNSAIALILVLAITAVIFIEK